MFPLVLIGHLVMGAAPAAASTPPLTTVSERSGFVQTGRYAEVQELCAGYAKRYPKHARCETFGTSPEGRKMSVLIATKSGALTPAAAKKGKRPVVLFQGGIHSGEIDGKDAGFLLLRELLDSTAADNPLNEAVAVFVPVFNVDGHERFGKNNRPNQVGPEEMGWRTTSRNLNLNRDYTKADAPEMVAMLELLQRWDPILYLDLHVTDGAKFEHDVAVMLEPLLGGNPLLQPQGKALQQAVSEQLVAQGHPPPPPFYPSFLREDDPRSGFANHVAPPRFSQGYWSLRNRFAALVETHAWRPYAHRVKTTHDVVLAFLVEAAKHGKAWLETAAQADRGDRSAPTSALPLVFAPTKKEETYDFRGVAYTEELSELSGKKWIRYDETKPEVWKVPYFSEVEPVVSVELGATAGYLVPAGWAELVREKLDAHDLDYEVLSKPRVLEGERFRATKKTFSPASVEGHQTLKVEGEWKAQAARTLPPGSLFVPLRQEGQRLVAHLLEPMGPDSLLAWGFFNTAFEQKEYIEDYVMEIEGRKMRTESRALGTEFRAKVKSDPTFAADPNARLRFFAERHPAWDSELDVYPVMRLAAPPSP